MRISYFRAQWHIWPPPALFVFLLLVEKSIAKMCSDGTHREDCDRYHCDTEHGKAHSPTEYFTRPGRSVFSHPCRCLPDWSQLFCNQTQSVLNLPSNSVAALPTICICRKFSDGGGNCHQFITRCFNKKSGSCSCCFNQPDDYCDHIKCSNGEPDFGSSNTTCVCHSNPADYPVHICGPSARAAPSLPPNTVDDVPEASSALFSMGGVAVSTTFAFVFVICALLVICMLTVILVINGQRKQKKLREVSLADHVEHRRRQRQNRSLRESTQKSDNEPFLPQIPRAALSGNFYGTNEFATRI